MIQTTLVGSYPRVGDKPQEQRLRQVLEKLDRKEADAVQVRQVEEETTCEVMNEMVQAGIDLVVDGQVRWPDALSYEASRIEGFSANGLLRYFDTNTYYRQPVVERRLQYTRSILIDDFHFAQSVTDRPVKVILTGPYTLARFSRNTFYESLSGLMMDLAYILNKELKALAEAGARYVQIDEPGLLHHKTDWSLFRRTISILTGSTSQLEKTLLLNFGNIEGLYPDLLELNVDVLAVDVATEPQNLVILQKENCTKKLCAGLVDARNTLMEKEEDLIERIQKLRQLFGEQLVYVSPNYSLEFLPRDVARKKMEVLVQAVKHVQSKISS